MTFFQRLPLLVAGLTAAAIGATIAIAPTFFMAGYGIVLGPEAAQLSETRAAGAGLLAMAGFMLAGLVRPALARLSLAIAAAVYLAYGAGRLLSLWLDGDPGQGLLVAALIEFGVGLACLVALRRLGPRARGLTGLPAGPRRQPS